MAYMATGNNSAGALRAFIERVERLDEEKKALSDDIRDIYAEAKGNGWDPKIMRVMIRRRKMGAAERNEQDTLVDTYSAALGMLPPADEADETETVVAEYRGTIRKDADGNIVDEGMKRIR